MDKPERVTFWKSEGGSEYPTDYYEADEMDVYIAELVAAMRGEDKETNDDIQQD